MTIVLVACADEGSRLAAALLDHGANSWGGASEHTGAGAGAVSPRPSKRLGPFKRPLPLQQHVPQTAPASSATSSPMIPPAPAPRRNR